MSAKDRFLCAGGFSSGFNIDSFESVQAASEEKSPGLKKGDQDIETRFPIQFTYQESERLAEDLQKMKTSLDHIFKGTATEKAIGHIKGDDLAPTKFKLDTSPQPNIYEEL